MCASGNLQLDCPSLAFFCSDEVEKGYADMNIEAHHVLGKYITLLNDCLKDKPADMFVGVHLCRGNLKVVSIRVLAHHVDKANND